MKAADPTLPVAARLAWLDGSELRVQPAAEGSGLPAATAWAGPARLDDLPAMLELLCSTPARRYGLLLEGDAVDDDTLEALEPGRLESLLALDCPRLSNAGMKHLARLGLKRLALWSCPGLSSGLQHFDASTVTHLWLSYCCGFSTLTLKLLHRWRQLELLDLRGGLASAGLMRWLSTLESLTSLDLSRDQVSAVGPLRALRSLPRLSRLALRRALLEERAVAELCKLRALRVLDLRGARIHPTSVTKLRKALGSTEILVDPAPQASPTHVARRAPPPTRSPCVEEAPARPAVARRAWPEQAPHWRELYVVVDGDRGNPEGTYRSFDRRLADELDPDAVLRTLEEGEPLSLLLTALALLPALVRGAPRLVDRALELLVRHLDDDRSERWEWGSASWHATELGVGDEAAAASLELLSMRRAGAREPAIDPAALAVLERLVRTALRRGRPGAERVLAFLVEGPLRGPGGEETLRTFLSWLEEAVADRSRPAGLRLQALEAVERSQARVPPALLPLCRSALDRCLAGLAAAAADPGADFRFRELARRKLACVDPPRLAALHEGGALRDRPLPSFEAITTRLGLVDAERAITCAIETTAAAAIAALRGREPQTYFSALALAPFLGTDAERLSLAELAAGLVGRPERYVLESGSSSVPLGQLAAEQLLALLPRLGDARPRLLGRALTAALGQEASDPTGIPPGLSSLSGPLEAELLGDLRERFLDRRVSAELRFALYLALPGLRKDLGLAPLVDEDEDPDLRAMVGTVGSWLGPRAFADLADTSVEPWCAERALPASEPAASVPLAWLVETLRISRCPVALRHAVPAIVGRLLPVDGGEEELRAGAAALRAVPHADAARALLDLQPPRRGGPRLTGLAALRVDPQPALGQAAAARWLAVLGDPQDEGRLAAHLLGEGWYPHSRGELATALDRLLAVCSSENVADDADSTMLPLLLVGFGAEQARRIESKAFVLLARLHDEAGRRQMASRAAAYASKLDPMNLDALRLVRRWPVPV